MQAVSVIRPMFEGQKTTATPEAGSVSEGLNANDAAAAGQESQPVSGPFGKILSLGKNSGGKAEAASGKRAGKETQDASDDAGESAGKDLTLLAGAVIVQLMSSIEAVNQTDAAGAGASEMTAADAAAIPENAANGIAGAAAGAAAAIVPGQNENAGAGRAAGQTGTAAGSLQADKPAGTSAPGKVPQDVLGASDDSQAAQISADTLTGTAGVPAAPEGKKEQAAGTKPDGGTGAVLFQSNLTEKLREALSAAPGGTSSDGGGLGKSASKESAEAPGTRAARADGAAPFGLMVAGQNPGAAHMAEAGDKAGAVEKAVNQIVSDMGSVKAGSSEIQIVLEPKELGMMTIVVSRTETGISAKIKSDDKEICALMTGHIQKLVQAIEDKGIKIENVEVIFKQTQQQAGQQDMGFAQNSPRGGRQDRPPAYYTPEEKKPGSSDLLRLSELLWGGLDKADETGNSVEYRV